MAYTRYSIHVYAVVRKNEHNPYGVTHTVTDTTDHFPSLKYLCLGHSVRIYQCFNSHWFARPIVNIADLWG